MLLVDRFSQVVSGWEGVSALSLGCEAWPPPRAAPCVLPEASLRRPPRLGPGLGLLRPAPGPRGVAVAWSARRGLAPVAGRVPCVSAWLLPSPAGLLLGLDMQPWGERATRGLPAGAGSPWTLIASFLLGLHEPWTIMCGLGGVFCLFVVCVFNMQPALVV